MGLLPRNLNAVVSGPGVIDHTLVVAACTWTMHSPDHRTHPPGTAILPSGREPLRRALAGAGLEARFQPMMDVQSQRPVALEALARLTLPPQVTLVPGDFLPQIEAAGLTDVLTDAVAERAFTDWASWPTSPRRPMLSINVSLDVFLSAPALIRLETRRIAAGIASQDILIELTESRPADDLPGLRRAVERMRIAGYAIALDDITPSLPFLDALLEMPFTDLKLDRAVVQAAPHWDDAAQFMHRMLRHAQDRNMKVTAEGVEDEATLAMVRASGVHTMQGYLSGRPMRAAEVPAWLAQWDDVAECTEAAA